MMRQQKLLRLQQQQQQQNQQLQQQQQQQMLTNKDSKKLQQQTFQALSNSNLNSITSDYNSAREDKVEFDPTDYYDEYEEGY